MMVREAVKTELYEVLRLYLFLHEKNILEDTEHLEHTWNIMMEDENHHVIVNEIDSKIVSSCICVIIPNLTRQIQSYALIENVVTDEEYRGKGYATECLHYAKEIAIKNNCYKMMLLTGAKDKSILDFYKKAGYNSEDKTAFIQWIHPSEIR